MLKRRDEPPNLGAYGLRLPGLGRAAQWLVPQDPEAASLELAVQISAPDYSPSQLDNERADLRLIGGVRLRACRGRRRVTFSVPEPLEADQLVHPYLAPAAALIWQWQGVDSLHGGVAAIGGGAVLVLGDKESGKTTTLACLERDHGCAVLADDLAVIRDGHVLSGPRSLDLRSGEPTIPGVPVRGGQRIRVELGPAPSSLRVAGTVVLVWGDRRRVAAVPASERLAVLATKRTYPLPGDPRALLELAAQPMFRLTRPRDPAGQRASAAALIDCFA
jgi:hypothetical protein